METKTSKAVGLLGRGCFKEALSIFRTFRCGFTTDERKLMQEAYECMSGCEQFYKSIGKDTDGMIRKCRVMLESKYLQDVD